MRIILCVFPESGKYNILKNTNVNKSDLKRKLLYELQWKKLNDQLEQITLFNQKQNIKRRNNK